MNTAFGKFVRARRQELARQSGRFSVRGVAGMLGIQPSYISKIERCEVAPPSENTIKKLAMVLMVDADELLALAGKVSEDVRLIIARRPKLLAGVLRLLKNLPDHEVLKMVQGLQGLTE